MSDGPHRSLNMRRGWKKVAEYADKGAFSSDEIGDAVASAYLQDARKELPDSVAHAVCEILGDQQEHLFRDQKVEQLEALRPLAAGHGFGAILIDCATQRAHSGAVGPDSGLETMAAALELWGARHARQIEEHYRRESTLRRATNVRTRIEEGIGGMALHGLARQILKLDIKGNGRTSAKKDGIDDGVRL